MKSRCPVPVGFTSIFNGKDLTGWHISKTNHHGATPDYHVLHGIIAGTQQPFGGGGILMTDRKYRNVEVYMEVKPDWGCDSGLFFWTDEDGGGYQVMLDYLPGGTMVAGVYGERLRRQHERAGLGESHAGAAPGDPDTADRELAEGLEAGSVECRARSDRGEPAPHHHVAQ
jgi:hypothetical protein